jgi:hypothetical protein
MDKLSGILDNHEALELVTNIYKYKIYLLSWLKYRYMIKNLLILKKILITLFSNIIMMQ